MDLIHGIQRKVAAGAFEFSQHAAEWTPRMPEIQDERLVEKLVTYSIEIDGQLIAVEHVPARVNEETGERLFSPETVERLQRIARERQAPSRTIQMRVFDFAV